MRADKGGSEKASPCICCFQVPAAQSHDMSKQHILGWHIMLTLKIFVHVFTKILTNPTGKPDCPNFSFVFAIL